MNLVRLAEILDLPCLDGDPSLTGLTEDSRTVAQGNLFVAVTGDVVDGRKYIDQARTNGATAVMLAPPDIPGIGPRIVVPARDIRVIMSRAARFVYDCPDEKLDLIGLTGTNGKTTTSYLLESVLAGAGEQPGVMGTVNFRWPGQEIEAPNTTPEGPLLYRTLASMATMVRAAILEVSSHALSLGRLGDLRFEAALFSNLTRDHLDYHGDMESYFQAKARLFREHLVEKEGPRAAINCDDPYGLRLMDELGLKALGFGFGDKADVRGRELFFERQGLNLLIESPNGSWRQKSPLLGTFNAMNILGTVTLGLILGVETSIMERVLATARGAPGRLERVGQNDDYLALVDYSHAPGALEQALVSLRAVGPRRLVVVFGCGGDRDRGKRPMMGEVAGKEADLTILTSDNPRTEDPLVIIREAEAGLAKVKKKGPGGYLVEPDRRIAIGLAVKQMEPGDILLVAGKGHETYQIIGREKIVFDDRLETLAALTAEGKA